MTWQRSANSRERQLWWTDSMFCRIAAPCELVLNVSLLPRFCSRLLWVDVVMEMAWQTLCSTRYGSLTSMFRRITFSRLFFRAALPCFLECRRDWRRICAHFTCRMSSAVTPPAPPSSKSMWRILRIDNTWFFLGASIMADANEQQANPKYWITRQEYQETGAGAVQRLIPTKLA
mmetsp:Transcript_12190/g.23038  ORF Transcript_12190/g.23038 Transcript_12190/m.23038 type:complete len:175 (+) Transcript_12190:714-1238(+)